MEMVCGLPGMAMATPALHTTGGESPKNACPTSPETPRYGVRRTTAPTVPAIPGVSSP